MKNISSLIPCLLVIFLFVFSEVVATRELKDISAHRDRGVFNGDSRLFWGGGVPGFFGGYGGYGGYYGGPYGGRYPYYGGGVNPNYGGGVNPNYGGGVNPNFGFPNPGVGFGSFGSGGFPNIPGVGRMP